MVVTGFDLFWPSTLILLYCYRKAPPQPEKQPMSGESPSWRSHKICVPLFFVNKFFVLFFSLHWCFWMGSLQYFYILALFMIYSACCFLFHEDWVRITTSTVSQTSHMSFWLHWRWVALLPFSLSFDVSLWFLFCLFSFQEQHIG